MSVIKKETYAQAQHFLNEWQKRIADVRSQVAQARHLDDTKRKFCWWKRILCWLFAVISIYLPLFKMREIVWWLGRHMYLNPTSFGVPMVPRVSYCLLASFFLFAAFLIAYEWRLRQMLKDDQQQHRAMQDLGRLDQETMRQINQLPSTVAWIEQEVQKGGNGLVIPQEALQEKTLNQLEGQSYGMVSPANESAAKLVRTIYWITTLVWMLTACFLYSPGHLKFLSETQTWYDWTKGTYQLAQFAYPVALIGLVAMIHLIWSWADRLYTVVRLLSIVVALVLASFVGWGLVVLPHIVMVIVKIILGLLQLALYAGVIVLIVIIVVGVIKMIFF